MFLSQTFVYYFHDLVHPVIPRVFNFNVCKYFIEDIKTLLVEIDVLVL